jgi:epoxyqueuosine reductase
MSRARQGVWRERLGELGFDAVRVAALSEPPHDGLSGWLAKGQHADMHWMERSAAKRLDPQLVLPGAKSIVMLGVSYWKPDTSRPGHPIWARYAMNEDYHDTIKPALAAAGHALEEIFGAKSDDYRYYVDTGPVLERVWAARAKVVVRGAASGIDANTSLCAVDKGDNGMEVCPREGFARKRQSTMMRGNLYCGAAV